MKRLFKKAMRDLFLDKRRAALSLLAILIGTLSFGMVLFCYEIISREIVSEYTAINPASATILVDRVDDALIALTEDFEGIVAFEEKGFYEMRVQTGENEWKTLQLFSSGDFSATELNKITAEAGAFQPGSDEMLIERAALGVANTALGETLRLQAADGREWDLQVTGVVADVSRHPAGIHNWVYAYVSEDTLHSMGLVNNRLDIVTAGDKYDRDSILSISNEYMKLLQQSGYTVKSIEVSDTPGVSMHLEEYKLSLVLLQIFSVITLLFGCMIMCSLISSIITRQIRQLGILKAIGAGSGKILASYLLTFLTLIAAASAVSLAVSVLLSGKTSALLMSIGNMQPGDTSIPLYLYAVFAAFTLVIPMVIACFTIRRGLRITVKDALTYYGVSNDNDRVSLPEPKRLSRPVLLSIRNAVRRKKRFYLNVAILSLGGALFIAVITSMLAIQTTLSNNIETLKYDYQVTTAYIEGETALNALMENIPHVSAYEKWGMTGARLINSAGEIGGTYSVIAPAGGSSMIAPELLAGSWLRDDDSNAVVLSHGFQEAGYQAGGTISLEIGGAARTFEIAGIIKDLGGTSVYMSENEFNALVPEADRYSSIKMRLNFEGRQRAIYDNVGKAFLAQDIAILQNESKAELYSSFEAHYEVTLQTFLLVIILLVAVAGFGLAATMNIQTAERTREIGIMKAMGAGRKQIARIVTAESIFIGLVSWLISLPLGIPLGITSVYVFGHVILETPLDVSILSFIGACALWLALTLGIGYLASRASGKRAAALSIRSSLAFE